ncbi:hypothetical protein Cob_v009996 [Colletotrichum orbiculare MAFF 240422]|uniref:Uncharacterized protein n=1 Tax=Colletotrichum orbiculare (strain 104-T / ATCC 96160 / CBS 514.97 / LARS 414 / MAFF 240422) TaxID=1213857 RepID=A0A484FH04_COLOR|nr:hypothetical protein Cob_v009996 [Colletotrichum orbiculare MAFF 240422]
MQGSPFVLPARRSYELAEADDGSAGEAGLLCRNKPTQILAEKRTLLGREYDEQQQQQQQQQQQWSSFLGTWQPDKSLRPCLRVINVRRLSRLNVT